jgi:hypothetical protein
VLRQESVREKEVKRKSKLDMQKPVCGADRFLTVSHGALQHVQARQIGQFVAPLHRGHATRRTVAADAARCNFVPVTSDKRE